MKKSIIIGALSIMLFAGNFTSAQVTDPAALQKIIDDLRAQIAQLMQSQQQSAVQMATLQSQLRLSRNLAPGQSGDDVKLLQQTLATDPTLFSGQPTGFFGNLTSEAVKKLQERLGLDQTGTIGPLTRAQLNQLFGDVSSSTVGLPAGLLRGGFAPIHADILPVGSIIAKGEVSLFPVDASTTRVVVHFGSNDDLSGTSTNTIYATHIHTGACASSGPISIPLTDITNNKSETTIQYTISGLFQMYPLSIMVHRAGVVVGCADLPAPRPIFRKMDANGDGKIDAKDTLEIQKADLMHRIDDNHDASTTRAQMNDQRPEMKDLQRKFEDANKRMWRNVEGIIPGMIREQQQGGDNQQGEGN